MSFQNRKYFVGLGVVLIGSACLLIYPLMASEKKTAEEDVTERGTRYYTTVYKCYACHGYNAQTGLKRLLPMNFDKETFIDFVQNSPLPKMPAYADAPAEHLSDIYTYLTSIPLDKPGAADTLLLEETKARHLPQFND